MYLLFSHFKKKKEAEETLKRRELRKIKKNAEKKRQEIKAKENQEKIIAPIVIQQPVKESEKDSKGEEAKETVTENKIFPAQETSLNSPWYTPPIDETQTSELRELRLKEEKEKIFEMPGPPPMTNFVVEKLKIPDNMEATTKPPEPDQKNVQVPLTDVGRQADLQIDESDLIKAKQGLKEMEVLDRHNESDKKEIQKTPNVAQVQKDQPQEPIQNTAVVKEKETAERSIKEIQTNQPEPQNQPKRTRILFIDDAKTFHLKMKQIVSTVYGADLVCVLNATDCLDLLGHDMNFDIIISDVEMPYMNGFDLLEQIKALTWQKQPKYYIASASPENLAKARSKEINSITKPLNTEDMVHLIERD